MMALKITHLDNDVSGVKNLAINFGHLLTEVMHNFI